ncbi:protein-methionine-sulfoxide reductase heme-binding subunit MsrQ [Gemmobacter denitrificans]|uniref:Protein-methionine-sulfoxide reductase heme-binding subunit MsrQ n=1 Tax=Gemmobacter denitrificans TaxID=3123040 RepID=A0ABU8BRU3_9RHOB
MDRVNHGLRRIPPGAIYLLGAIPAAVLIWQALTGGLGVDPVKVLEHRLGEWALQFLVAGLAITPLRRLTGLNLIRFRRAIGLLAFAYASLHLAVWLALDLQFRWAEIAADLLKRPYIILGMLAFVLLLPLAATSNNTSVRKLGADWRRLHLLTYPAVLLAALHFVWLTKAWALEPLIYLVATIGLLMLRGGWQLRRMA